LQPSAREQLYVHAHPSAQKRAQLQPAIKKRSCPVHKVLHKRDPCAVENSPAKQVFRISMRFHELERNVDAPPPIIARHVLPEICQLQRGTGLVTQPLPPLVAVPAQIEHEAAYGVGRIPAVPEESFPCPIARL